MLQGIRKKKIRRPLGYCKFSEITNFFGYRFSLQVFIFVCVMSFSAPNVQVFIIVCVMSFSAPQCSSIYNSLRDVFSGLIGYSFA